MFLGLKIGSYCGFIAHEVEKHFQPYIDNWNNFEADKVISILEKATNKSVGDPVSIPVKVVDKGCEGRHETGVGFDQFENDDLNKKNPDFDLEMWFFSFQRRRENWASKQLKWSTTAFVDVKN